MNRATGWTRAGWLVAVVLAGLAACAGGNAASGPADGPWGMNTVAPADLARELAGPDKPVVVATGPAVMFRTGHVPGALYHGPAMAPEALAELKAWARTLPPSTNLVIYCGCCPLDHCPNLRPAWAALSGLGFTRLRVLILPSDFGTDWVQRGYPIER